MNHSFIRQLTFLSAWRYLGLDFRTMDRKTEVGTRKRAGQDYESFFKATEKIEDTALLPHKSLLS